MNTLITIAMLGLTGGFAFYVFNETIKAMNSVVVTNEIFVEWLLKFNKATIENKRGFIISALLGLAFISSPVAMVIYYLFVIFLFVVAFSQYRDTVKEKAYKLK